MGKPLPYPAVTGGVIGALGLFYTVRKVSSFLFSLSFHEGSLVDIIPSRAIDLVGREFHGRHDLIPAERVTHLSNRANADASLAQKGFFGCQQSTVH